MKYKVGFTGQIPIFYRDFQYASGLIPLGAIDSGLEKLASVQGEFQIRIEAQP